MIEDCDAHGRRNSFLVNKSVVIYIKHSTKRLSPWSFTFNRDHMYELVELARLGDCFIVLVCGIDGNAVVSLKALTALLNGCESKSAFVRVSRKRNSMYAVYGPDGKLERQVARGLGPVVQAID